MPRKAEFVVDIRLGSFVAYLGDSEKKGGAIWGEMTTARASLLHIRTEVNGIAHTYF